jgi:hypothetical protein
MLNIQYQGEKESLGRKDQSTKLLVPKRQKKRRLLTRDLNQASLHRLPVDIKKSAPEAEKVA